MKTITKPGKRTVGRPRLEKRRECVNTRISKAAYAFIAKEAKLQRRSIMDTFDLVLGV